MKKRRGQAGETHARKETSTATTKITEHEMVIFVILDPPENVGLTFWTLFCHLRIAIMLVSKDFSPHLGSDSTPPYSLFLIPYSLLLTPDIPHMCTDSILCEIQQ